MRAYGKRLPPYHLSAPWRRWSSRQELTELPASRAIAAKIRKLSHRQAGPVGGRTQPHPAPAYELLRVPSRGQAGGRALKELASLLSTETGAQEQRIRQVRALARNWKSILEDVEQPAVRPRYSGSSRADGPALMNTCPPTRGANRRGGQLSAGAGNRGDVDLLAIALALTRHQRAFVHYPASRK